jgi:hypothetical protein
MRKASHLAVTDPSQLAFVYIWRGLCPVDVGELPYRCHRLVDIGKGLAPLSRHCLDVEVHPEGNQQPVAALLEANNADRGWLRAPHHSHTLSLARHLHVE